MQQVLGNAETYLREMNQMLDDYIKFLSSDALLMDAYTLARMFRKFPNGKHVPSTQIVVYAGDAHIQTYVDFFSKVLGINPDFRQRYGGMAQSPIRCIKAKNQPLSNYFKL